MNINLGSEHANILITMQCDACGYIDEIPALRVEPACPNCDLKYDRTAWKHSLVAAIKRLEVTGND